MTKMAVFHYACKCMAITLEYPARELDGGKMGIIVVHKV